MIGSIEISRFRGIREGKLENLTPLTVLVGPNGCGKSSVLDALLVGAAPKPEESIGQAVQRHQGVVHGARWLFWRAGNEGTSTVKVTTRADSTRTCVLELKNPQMIHWRIDKDGTWFGPAGINFQPDLTYSATMDAVHPLEDVSEVRIVERLANRIQSPLHQLLTECSEQGQRSEVRDTIAELTTGLKDLLILTEGDTPTVYLEYEDHSVPAALSGDGIHSLLRTSLELFARPRGVVLLEEPEVHQHPAAIGQTVRATLAAVRRGIQVVLTTHSLELIDYLVALSSEEDLERLSLYRLELADGKLISIRKTGSQVASARGEIEEDLR